MKYVCTMDNICIGSILLCVADGYVGNLNYLGKKAKVVTLTSTYLTLNFNNGWVSSLTLPVLNGEESYGGGWVRFIPWNMIPEKDKFIFEMTGELPYVPE